MELIKNHLLLATNKSKLWLIWNDYEFFMGFGTYLEILYAFKNVVYFRILDVSQSMRETALYPRPVTALHSIVTALKHLTHLDISSTNLAAQPTANDWPSVDNKWAKIYLLKKIIIFYMLGLSFFMCLLNHV